MAAFLIFLFMISVFSEGVLPHPASSTLQLKRPQKIFQIFVHPFSLLFLANPSVENLCYCEQKTEEGVSKQIYNFVTDGKADFN